MTDNQGAEFGKIDLENTLYDIVMRNESAFVHLQLPWHIEEGQFINHEPQLFKIGKVDEYLLKVLNKLIWIDCDVNDIYNMAKKERGREKIELGLGPLTPTKL